MRWLIPASGRPLFRLRHLLKDSMCALFCQRFELVHKLFRRHAFFAQQPALHGADHRIAQKIQSKFVWLFLAEQGGNTLRDKRPNILPEVIAEGVLSFDLQGFAVKRVVLVKIPAGFFDKSPVFCVSGTEIFVFQKFDEFCIKDPIYNAS